MGDNLKNKTIGSIAWITIDRFGQQAIQFLIGLVMARLLLPSDFGIIGMIMKFVSLSSVLVESGFSNALIRKKDANELDYNTIYYFNILVSIVLYIVLFFTLPYIADFFKQNQLVPIGRVIFLSVFFNALCLVPSTMLIKNMDYKTLAKANIFSIILSGFGGVILAFLGYGVWALVVQQVTFNFFRMIAILTLLRWYPQKIFSLQVIQDFWKFSMNLLGTSMLNVIFNNIYMFILSRYYPLNKVGLYTQANKFNETFVSTFQTVLVGSTYPLFAQIHDDENRIKRIYREFAKKTSMITFPVMFTLIVAAKPIFFVLFSSKWLPAVPYFQLICFASIFSTLYSLNINILNACGLSKLTFKLEFLKKILITVSIILCFKYGILLMLSGYAISNFISYGISTIYLKQNFNHYLKHQFLDIAGPIAIAILTSAIVFGTSFIFENFYLLLFAQAIVFLVIYILSIRFFYNDLYHSVINYIGIFLKIKK